MSTWNWYILRRYLSAIMVAFPHITFNQLPGDEPKPDIDLGMLSAIEESDDEVILGVINAENYPARHCCGGNFEASRVYREAELERLAVQEVHDYPSQVEIMCPRAVHHHSVRPPTLAEEPIESEMDHGYLEEITEEDNYEMTNNPPTTGLDLLLSPWAPREPVSNSHESHIIPYSTMNDFSAAPQPSESPQETLCDLEPWSNAAMKLPELTHQSQPLLPACKTPPPTRTWKSVNKEMLMTERRKYPTARRVHPVHPEDAEYKCMWGPESEWCGRHLSAELSGPQFLDHLEAYHGIGPDDLKAGQRCRWRTELVDEGEDHLEMWHECGLVKIGRSAAVKLWKFHILHSWKHLWLVRDGWSLSDEELDDENMSDSLKELDEQESTGTPDEEDLFSVPAPANCTWKCVNEEMRNRIELERPEGRSAPIRPMHQDDVLYRCMWGPESKWCGKMLSSELTSAGFLDHLTRYHGIRESSLEKELRCRWRSKKDPEAPETECGYTTYGRPGVLKVWKSHIWGAWKHLWLVADGPGQENATEDASIQQCH